MGSQPIGRVALMSIHPVYANAILCGDKQVEFRKRRLASDVTHILLYATAPVGAIVGAFIIAGQETSTPVSLWRRFAKVSGISHRKFFEYYATSDLGTGIRVGSVLIPRQPLNLMSSLGIRRPPQSFQYVKPTKALSVLNAMAGAHSSSKAA